MKDSEFYVEASRDSPIVTGRSNNWWATAHHRPTGQLVRTYGSDLAESKARALRILKLVVSTGEFSEADNYRTR